MDIKQLRICHPEPCVRDLKKTRMIEILRFAQKRSSPPEGAKGNDKVNGFFIILSCWSEATRNLVLHEHIMSYYLGFLTCVRNDRPRNF